MLKTMHLRFVEKLKQVGDENKTVRVLQQWFEAEGYEHEDIVEQGGYWSDVELSAECDKEFPE